MTSARPGLPVALHLEQGAADPPQPQRGRQDDAGQAHPAGSGQERSPVTAGGQPVQAALAVQQLDLLDPAGDAAVAVLVLAVDVRGDGPADGQVPGPRQYRQQEPQRDQLSQQRREGHRRPDPDGAGHGVRLDQLRSGWQQHAAARVLCRVPVTAPAAPGQHPRAAAG